MPVNRSETISEINRINGRPLLSVGQQCNPAPFILNFQQLDATLQRAKLHLGDGLAEFDKNAGDLILCNPPFHQSHAIGDTVALSMFRHSARVLRDGGELWVVGNRHLDYHLKLRRWFSSVEVVASNKKFVVIRAIV
jgi:23S rRNA (guanine1835-N2)-methyltransferase